MLTQKTKSFLSLGASLGGCLLILLGIIMILNDVLVMNMDIKRSLLSYSFLLSISFLLLAGGIFYAWQTKTSKQTKFIFSFFLSFGILFLCFLIFIYLAMSKHEGNWTEGMFILIFLLPAIFFYSLLDSVITILGKFSYLHVLLANLSLGIIFTISTLAQFWFWQWFLIAFIVNSLYLIYQKKSLNKS